MATFVTILVTIITMINTNPNIPQATKDEVFQYTLATIEKYNKPVVETQNETPKVENNLQNTNNVSITETTLSVVEEPTASITLGDVFIKSPFVFDFTLGDTDRLDAKFSWDTTPKNYSITYKDKKQPNGDSTIETEIGLNGMVEVIFKKDGKEVGKVNKSFITTENGIQWR